MNKLSHAQLNLIAQHLRQAKSHSALEAELVDHMASLLEQRMNQGQDFTTAFEQLIQQTPPQVMQGLSQRYKQEFLGHRANATLFNRRAKRRPATKPFLYIFLSSGLTLLILMGGFLIVACRPLALPIGVFRTTWAIGLVGFGGVLAVRWWLKSRLYKSNSFASA